MTAPRTIIDVHVVQTVPPSNLNRDDTGSPKTAVYGGVRRSRVSSQSWKRAIRKDFEDKLTPQELGTRSKRLVARLADEITELAPDTTYERAVELAKRVLNSAGLKTKDPKKAKGAAEVQVPEIEALAFLSAAQIKSLSAYALESDGSVDASVARQLADTEHSIDIALFGRMVASNPALNVDAACQVAHAISTHSVSNEFDYYTAVDDAKESEESLGAGMVGVIEFNSATLYRFATVDVNRLADNLGDDAAAATATLTFLSSMVTSMPSGKQNTFANRTLPDAVVVSLRSDQPVSFAAAYERPVGSTDGQIAESVARLAAYGADVTETWGAAAERTWVITQTEHADAVARLGLRATLPEALADIKSVLSARFGLD